MFKSLKELTMKTIDEKDIKPKSNQIPESLIEDLRDFKNNQAQLIDKLINEHSVNYAEEINKLIKEAEKNEKLALRMLDHPNFLNKFGSYDDERSSSFCFFNSEKYGLVTGDFLYKFFSSCSKKVWEKAIENSININLSQNQQELLNSKFELSNKSNDKSEKLEFTNNQMGF